MLQELLNAIDVEYEKLLPYIVSYRETDHSIEGLLHFEFHNGDVSFKYIRGSNDIIVNDRNENLDIIKNFLHVYRHNYDEERNVLASSFGNRYEHILKDDVSGWVRSGVIHNETCSEETMIYLSSDTDIHVRCSLASKINCPPEILFKLSLLNNVKAETQVRINVAKNKNCPIDILRRLVSDKSSSVRLVVLYREDCPEDLIRILTMDANEDIRKAAKNKLKNL